MGLRIAFETLGEIVEHYESQGHSVRTVETTAAPAEAGGIRATLAVTVSLDSLLADDTRGGLSAEATLTDDGSIRLSVTPPSLSTPPSTPHAAVSVTDATVEADEDRALLRLSVSIEPTGPTASTTTTGIADTGSSDTDRSATESNASTTVSPSESEPRSASSESSASSSSTSTASSASSTSFEAIRDESVPAYEDVPYLQSLYEECENFREMSRLITMDVSSETVRRYMIEADIHQPASYDTTSTDTEAAASDGAADTDADAAPTERDGDGGTDAENDTDSQRADSDTPAVEPADSDVDTGLPGTERIGTDAASVTVSSTDAQATATERLEEASIATDGLGLPADLELEDVADAVVGAATIHEVQRQLGLERERTRDLLDELNLIDLVSRRLVDSDRTVSYDQVADRLRQRAPSGA